MSEYTEQEIREANEKIAQLVTQSTTTLKEAQDLANRYGLHFEFEPLDQTGWRGAGNLYFDGDEDGGSWGTDGAWYNSNC